MRLLEVMMYLKSSSQLSGSLGEKKEKKQQQKKQNTRQQLRGEVLICFFLKRKQPQKRQQNTTLSITAIFFWRDFKFTTFTFFPPQHVVRHRRAQPRSTFRHHVDLFVVKNGTTNEIRNPKRVVQDGWFQVFHILFPLPSARRPDQHLSAAERERNCTHYDALIAAHNNAGRWCE